MGSEMLNFVINVISGIVVGLATLPFTDEAIRGKLFGKCKRDSEKRRLEANQALYKLVGGMLLKGKSISGADFENMRRGIAQKYQISDNLLDSREAIICSLLEASNDTAKMPLTLNKELLKQIDQFAGNNDERDNDRVEYQVVIDGSDEWISEDAYLYWQEFVSDQGNHVNASDPKYRWLETYCIGLLSFIIGALVIVVINLVTSRYARVAIICFVAFIICANILMTLFGKSVIRESGFIKKLVYKIILLMILLVLGIVLVV